MNVTIRVPKLKVTKKGNIIKTGSITKNLPIHIPKPKK